MRGSFRTHSVVEVFVLVAWSLGETVRDELSRRARPSTRAESAGRVVRRPALRLVDSAPMTARSYDAR